ncbi:AAA family ATPase [Marivivens sp. JLT3646]|uniref:AAA family ATPase n=1 Tax=Marivivens sp. JLT3646 TaxID=1920883 RepID=UPI0007FC7934|nr:AAA family ATPase [Marivivens sp. JLT3646]APO87202.1 hypothetical protein BSK21_09200 [Marivivens sp. JLT3646]OBR39924.1 hypothetical protein A9199_02885 [Donghicola sp. JL3646]
MANTHNYSSVFIPRSTVACFCVSEDCANSLTQVSSSPIMSRAHVSVAMGGLEAAILAFPVGRTPDVIIVEHDGDIEELEQLAEVCAISTSVIVIGSTNDVVLYRKLSALGVADYLFKPLDDVILIDTLARVFASRRVGRGGTVCSVFSAGGGTGSSTIAQNFAVALAKSPDVKICVIDLDMAMGTTALNFDLKPMRGLRELLLSQKDFNIADVEQTAIDRRNGVSILASVPSLQDFALPDPERVGHLLELARTLWDYIIIDLPPGWSELHADMFATSEMALIVAKPNLSSFQAASVMMRMNESLRKTLTKPQIVLNRLRRRAKTDLKSDDFLRISGGLPVHEFSENDALYADATEQGKVVMELPKTGDLEQSFSDLVAQLTGTHFQQTGKNAARSLKLWRRK